jgi:hypothetical protein
LNEFIVVDVIEGNGLVLFDENLVAFSKEIDVFFVDFCLHWYFSYLQLCMRRGGKREERRQGRSEVEKGRRHGGMAGRRLLTTTLTHNNTHAQQYSRTTTLTHNNTQQETYQLISVEMENTIIRIFSHIETLRVAEIEEVIFRFEREERRKSQSTCSSITSFCYFGSIENVCVWYCSLG